MKVFQKIKSNPVSKQENRSVRSVDGCMEMTPTITFDFFEFTILAKVDFFF